MTFRTTSWLLLSLMVPLLSACGGATRQDRAVERAEANTASRESDVDEAEQNAERSRASQEVLEQHDPEAIEDANRVLEETPEAEPMD